MLFWLVVRPRDKLFLWLPVITAMVLSAAVNGIDKIAMGRIWLLCAASMAFTLAIRYNTTVSTGLAWAGVLWPLALLVGVAVGNTDNANVVGGITVIFVLALLAARAPRLPATVGISVNIAVLLVFGSRGAMLAIMAAGIVMLWPHVSHAKIIAVACLPLPLLFFLRPETALYRLYYWQQALTAWQHSPLFGLGPSKLWAGHWITEPGGGWQIHAHNAAISWIAENGVSGVVLILMMVWLAWRKIPHSRPIAIIVAALLVASIVDEPLWWPGPLLLAAALAGSSIKKPG